MHKAKLFLCLCVALVIGAVGWFGLSAASNTNGVDVIESAEPLAGGPLVSGPLDGMTFNGELGPDGKPKDVIDLFVFENGKFLSKECELRCKYPARPYFVRKTGDQTEFISETKCPYKEAKIIWRGRVEGDTINGVATWTIKRWYWTVEKNYAFTGKLAGQSTPVSSSQ